MSSIDRSSRPGRSPNRLAAERVLRDRGTQTLTDDGGRDRRDLRLPLSTVSLWLKRIGLGKRSRLEPPEPPNRYERRHPGELVHVDIKMLGRIRGAGHRVTGSRASAEAHPARGPAARGYGLGVRARHG